MIMKKAKRKIKLTLKNSLETGHVFYGLHMHEGPAHYENLNMTVMLSNSTIKSMNQTFSGKPVYVGHVEDHTDLADADGIVADSFYNPLDGNHWCKFVVTTQKGLDAINRGWTLSNSLLVDEKNVQGGQWHGIDYHATVERGTFHHLGIVPNPRYQQSIILTPSRYKQYNKEKEAELEMLSNSKERPMKFQIFKKTKVDNSKEINLEEMTVILPKKKKEVTLAQLVNEADAAPVAEDFEFDLDGTKMTVKQLIKMFKDLKAEFESLEIIEDEVEEVESELDESEQLSNSNDDEEDDDLDDSSELDEEDLDALDADDSEEDSEEEEKPAKLSNSKKTAKKVVSKEAKKKNIKKLSNAAQRAERKLSNSKPVIVELSSDQIRRGSERYGSSKN